MEEHAEENRPRIIRGIATAVLFSVIFIGVFFLATLIIALIMGVLANIPLIGKIIEWLFIIRDDSPAIALPIFAASCAYLLTGFIAEKMNKESKTLVLSHRICGAIIALTGVTMLIMNAIAGQGIWANIVLIITGVVFAIKSK